MRRTLKTLRELALTVVIALAVFLGAQAWQTRATPERWQHNGLLTWVQPDGTRGSGTWQDPRAQIGIAPDAPLALHGCATPRWATPPAGACGCACGGRGACNDSLTTA
jgi:hypothetical protein